MTDYYEFLQISPHADADTIHRVYRFLAARFHPDNPGSGDAELFHLVRTAYEVLSDPERRAAYDAGYQGHGIACVPLSSSVDFMDDIEGEVNRRVALLAVLYHRRRTKPDMPEVTLDEIETRMGFPRDYLDFTIWYLTKKGYITRSDNAQFTLSADGVDFVEMQRPNLPVLNKLLTSGSGPDEKTRTIRKTRVPEAVHGGGDSVSRPSQSENPRSRIVVPAASDRAIERRVNTTDRRQNGRGRRATDYSEATEAAFRGRKTQVDATIREREPRTVRERPQ